MLLSGCDNHQAGMGVMQPTRARSPNSRGQWQAYAEYVGYIESDGTSAAAALGIDRFYEFRLGED
ncbi:hypothetical protein [Rhodococcus sp. IEGM 1408]|uniref:hypothetical protein n=1 Tax=Rhodococcus sp. IEGM 1408 TaxID=3082220 RepID=UPI0029539313|nr:hypothetical protein [Rhodococcus sp. IEGM 1408]MDV8000647.1 hypothetical protein [Rhodococcus sp. IEGM 1408]